MQDEDTEIDFTEPDALEENAGVEQRRARNLWGKVFMWSTGIGCVVYYGAKLSNWLIGFPASIKNAGDVIFSIVGAFIGISILSIIVSFIDSTIKEFRIRFRQMTHRLNGVPERPVFMHEYLSEQAAWKTTDRLDGRTEGDIDPEYNPETHDLVVKGIKCFEIGRDYDSGLTVPKNRELAVAWYKKAVPWYELAANKGDAYAQEHLGDFYSKGFGVSQNKDKALFWWRKSADNGRVSVQYQLGQKYYFGEDVEKNYVEALFWFQVVLASHPSGFIEEKRQATNYGNDAALQLTSSVLSEVQERVRKWHEDQPTKR
jgi:hypothetical protein